MDGARDPIQHRPGKTECDNYVQGHEQARPQGITQWREPTHGLTQYRRQNQASDEVQLIAKNK